MVEVAGWDEPRETYNWGKIRERVISCQTSFEFPSGYEISNDARFVIPPCTCFTDIKAWGAWYGAHNNKGALLADPRCKRNRIMAGPPDDAAPAFVIPAG